MEGSAVPGHGHGPVQHPDGSVSFRVWAPTATHVDLVLDGAVRPMARAARGWWWRREAARADARYAFRLDGGEPLPDPASRRQPDGPHGWSALARPPDPGRSRAQRAWRAPPLAGAVLYELHVGAFTPEGTFDAACRHLADLVALGVTHVEVMPVNTFEGAHGWGYDGVGWYAVHEPYGGPEGFARFVDACHAHGLGVVLDVVYNHLGPSGNYLPRFGPYLTDRYRTPWGAALNLDGPQSDPVRTLIVDNALMWLGDYRVDGLRLDAVHDLVDTSAVHILTELAGAVRELEARTGRSMLLIAESDRQDPATIVPLESGGQGLDGQWLDDFHHGLHVALTGEADGYYADYTGLPDVAASYERGFVYDGRFSQVRERTVGAPLGTVPSHRLISCLQNHDQVGNRARGERLTTLVDAASLRAAIGLLCAAPSTPLLFMGEEYGERRPFRYFSAFEDPELAAAVSMGRREEFAAFTGFAGDVPDPQDPATFADSRLDRTPAGAPEGTARRALWRDLLALRRAEPALVSGDRSHTRVLHVDDHRLVILRDHPAGRPVLVAASLGETDTELRLDLAHDDWTVRCATGDERYGGDGRRAAVHLDGDLVLRLPGRSTTLLAGPVG